jgi:hypothetical protein
MAEGEREEGAHSGETMIVAVLQGGASPWDLRVGIEGE